MLHLLKGGCWEFIITQPIISKALYHRPNLQMSLILEFLEALTGEQDHENDIATLRESCEEENLDVDGSRQVLIERLKKKRKSADIEN